MTTRGTTALRQSFHNEKPMNDQNLEAAERLFEPARPAPAISECAREQQSIRANNQRLKAERLAHEARRVRSTPNCGHILRRNN
jgi:hypothetical protein